MDARAVLDFLVGLAEEVGITVRVVPRSVAEEGAPVAHSGPCRIRGEPWLMLLASDSLEDQIGASVAALRQQGDVLEERYLPPAVRDKVDSLDGISA